MGRRLSGAAGASPDTTQTLIDGATINWDLSKGNIATVTLAGNRVMANPTNLKVGGVSIIMVQDATGNRSITSWGSAFRFPSQVSPTLSTAANSRDVISGFCDGNNIYLGYMRNM